MSDLYCPQCLMPHTIDCREAGCPGEGQFKRLADLKPEAPDRKMLETMGDRIQDLETLMLTLADGMGTGAVVLPFALGQTMTAEAAKIRKGDRGGEPEAGKSARAPLAEVPRGFYDFNQVKGAWLDGKEGAGHGC